MDEIVINNLLETPTRKIISVVLTVEGGHAFNSGLTMKENTAKPLQVLDKIRRVKDWKHRPLFVTFAHHFYNELCGHARSINISLLKENQNRGINTGITDLGMDAIKLLLDNKDGNRIPLDIKHMSTVSRKAYYRLLDTEYSNEDIPVIALQRFYY